MSEVRSYRDLIVWQKSMVLAKEVYSDTRCFPREEVYGLTEQIRRAAVSIPANTAEGQARGTTGDFCRFIRISRGSLAELETELLLSRDLGYGDAERVEVLLASCDEISRLQAGLLKSLGASSAHPLPAPWSPSFHVPRPTSLAPRPFLLPTIESPCPCTKTGGVSWLFGLD